jgi:hypothetical protein
MHRNLLNFLIKKLAFFSQKIVEFVTKHFQKIKINSAKFLQKKDWCTQWV